MVISRWALPCSLLMSLALASTGCGYLDEEIQMTDEAYGATFGVGLASAMPHHGWSSGCGGAYGTSGGYGYGYGSRTYDFGAMEIAATAPQVVGVMGTAGSVSVALDQEKQFARDTAPLGTIEVVIAATVRGREAAVAQFAQARSSRDAR